MLQLVVNSQVAMQGLHAKGHVVRSSLVHILRSEFLDGLGLGVVLPGVLLVHVLEQGTDAIVCRCIVEELGRHRQTLGQIHAELQGGGIRDIGYRSVYRCI